jgi:hypothetical protein
MEIVYILFILVACYYFAPELFGFVLAIFLLPIRFVFSLFTLPIRIGSGFLLRLALTPQGLLALGALAVISIIFLNPGTRPRLYIPGIENLPGISLNEDIPQETDKPGNLDPGKPSDQSKPEVPPIPTDPTQPPAEGWEWRGKQPPGNDEGAWYNPETGESLHPDLNHKPPIGPHWDYVDPKKNKWRIFPDGKVLSGGD